MRLTLIARLRVGFVLLGVALMAPLAFVIHSVNERVEAQRRLRHQVVAERIFDELERELTAVLELESERPSAAYDAGNTNADAWAPFVVGYFKTSDGGATELVAATQLHPARRERLRRSLARWTHDELDQRERQAEPEPAPPGAAPTRLAPSPGPALAPAPVKAPARSPASKTSPEILRQLNRAREVRSKAQKKQGASDPLKDYGY